MKSRLVVATLVVFAVFASHFTSSAHAVVTGPYTADANTRGLYHFDETSGGTDPGNPFVDSGANGFDLDDTGGFDGRDNTGAGGYGGAAFAGFGSSLDVLNSGNGAYNGGASATGGGALHTGSVAQATNFQGASGEFTYEALIKLPNITQDHTIISRDGGNGDRGWFLQTSADGELDFFTGTGAAGDILSLAIPTTGPDQFVADEWFHVAVTYDGNAGVADNAEFYWTRVDPSRTEANSIGTVTFDEDATSNNQLLIGSQLRGPFRREPDFVDEVRISDVVRGADEFIFAAATATAPEPSTAILALLGLVGCVASRRRKRRA